MQHPTNLPIAFEHQMKVQLGEEFEAFRKSLSAPAPVSIRLNPLKPSPIAAGSSVPWCATGRYLDQRPSFTLDPHFHGGAYYVQEPSSMFLEQAVRNSVDVSQPLRVLDLCAAPGGKSTHLLSLLHRDSLVVSNEVIRSRASILSENIQKWGQTNVAVTNSDPSSFAALPGFFDVVVVDAPCSGEGLFRKDPHAIAEWSPDTVALCSSRQRRILQDVWPTLKSNGVLIYCTCTYNEHENERNLKWLSEQHSIEFVSLPAREGVREIKLGSAIGYRFYPHEVEGDGFFTSVMRKLDGQEETVGRRMKTTGKTKAPLPWLTGDFITLERNDLIIAVPASLAADMEMISSRLNIVTQGVAVGTTKHGKFIPEHALALSTDINKQEFSTVDLDREQAIQYLRKDNLMLHDQARGLSLVQFEGNPLGWVNVLDRRVNNLYPPNWRIKNL
jgi:16S rRNA C967 or C1407 C5-methylase (RsmB/RsmF family)/NOL1/NOP2/fmu family ribosome biogenesis protein